MTEALGPKGSIIRIDIPGGELVNARITNTQTGEQLDNVAALRIEADVNSPTGQAEVWLKLVNVDVAIEAVLQDYEVVKAGVSDQYDIHKAVLEQVSDEIKEKRRAQYEREMHYFKQSLVASADAEAKKLNTVIASEKAQAASTTLENLYKRGVLTDDEIARARAELVEGEWEPEEGTGC